MSAFLIVLHVEHGHGVAYPCCLRYAGVFAIGIESAAQRGVEGCCRIKQLVLEGQLLPLLYAGKHTQVNCQKIVEGLLPDVELGNVVAEMVGLDDCLMIHQAQRGAVVAGL